MLHLKNYIGGELLEPLTGDYLENIAPATGQAFSCVPASGAQDVERAVEAARRAFPAWRTLPAEQRFQILNRIADLIDRDADRLAEAESQDSGKPLALCKRMDIPRAASNFRFFATAVLHFASEAYATDETAVNYTLRQPIGVVGCISPWNLPLYLFSWKIAPALATGNCVVAKPSELTPLTAYLLSELCIEAGLPDGVLNILHGTGPGVGATLVAHPEIKAISFTGGTKTGADIARVAAPAFKKLSLELGGKNASLVFADCDYAKTLEGVVRSSFTNQGQICLCSSRILVERPIYERFRDDFTARVATLQVGDPLEPSSDLGAVVSAAHRDKVMGYVELARTEGGRILTGGQTLNPGGSCAGGYFIAPTVIEGLPHTCRTNQEEIFGPVVTLAPFDTEAEALEMANSVRYGLSATVWTENLTRTHRLARELEAGVIWVNTWLLRDLRTPFGGLKESGVGREGGFEAMRFFTEAKNICIKL